MTRRHFDSALLVAFCGLSGFGVLAAHDVCPPSTSSLYFFPERSVDDDAGSDGFRRNWYSKHLRAMREPSLSCGVDSNREIYRFTWLRTFHHPVSIRIEKNAAGGAELVAVELDGAGGYEPGEPKRTNRRALDPSQMRTVEERLANGVFDDVERQPGLDGAEWIFERSVKGEYAVAVEWSPNSGLRRAAGLYLISLSGWSFRDVY